MKKLAGTTPRTIEVPVQSADVAEYTFTDAERGYFGQFIAEFNRVTDRINNATSLVVTQQQLDGRWTLKQDGSGLVRVPEAAEASA